LGLYKVASETVTWRMKVFSSLSTCKDKMEFHAHREKSTKKVSKFRNTEFTVENSTVEQMHAACIILMSL